MEIAKLCDALLKHWEHDCSGFAKAVAQALKITLDGDANAIATMLAGGADGWTKLPSGAAAAEAASGRFVLAGLRGDELTSHQSHGHVVIVVPGPLNRGKYPSAFWGALGGTPGYDKTINWAWPLVDLDKVHYAATAIPG